MTTGRPRFDPRQPQQRGPAVRVNHRIRVPEVRVVGADGAMIGVLTTHEALQMAQQQGLDLVEVNPKAVPPVCKILDFGKYKYETARQAREAKRKQAVVDIKEIKLRPKTDDHDLDFKTRAARRFIESGNKVKFTVRFRGREITHPEKAQRHLDAVAVKLEDIANIEVRPLMEGRAMTLLIAPKPHIMQKVAHARAQREKERALAAREGRAVAPEFEEPEEHPDLEDDDDDDDDEDEEDEKDTKEAKETPASLARADRLSLPRSHRPTRLRKKGNAPLRLAGRLPFVVRCGAVLSGPGWLPQRREHCEAARRCGLPGARGCVTVLHTFGPTGGSGRPKK
jgi:translation initiation factor IF-3